jgi:LacI family transcriptional regulator
LKDVARLAGVSLGSASRALTVPDQVKAKTLEAVRTAAAQLAYVSNGAARALVSKRTFAIGAVYPTMTNDAYVNSLVGLQGGLWTKKYQIMLATHEYSQEREYDVVRTLIERGVDGVVIVGSHHHQGVFDLIRDRDVPLVMMWQLIDSPYGACVGFDQTKPHYQLTKMVIEQGHRDIAVICAPPGQTERTDQRVAGVLRAMTEAGLELRPEWMVHQPLSLSGGRAGIARLMAGSARPTAVVCQTDLHALGALFECARRGVKVPDEMSITGMDDIELAALATPPLTTIRVPTREIGEIAARMITELIENPGAPVENIDTPWRIMARDSLGPPPGPTARGPAGGT